MDIQDLIKKYNNYESKSDLFKDNEFLKKDAIVNIEQVKIVEQKIGLKFPHSYVQFCTNFGGGYFGLAIIYSLDQDGEFYLMNMIDELKEYLPPNVLPISEDQTGGYYGFIIEGNIISEKICYVNEMSEIEDVSYLNFFDLVTQRAFPQS